MRQTWRIMEKLCRCGILTAQEPRKFVAKEIREETDKVYYATWVDRTLLCVVWISAKRRETYGSKPLEEWCRSWNQ